jgi:hypothetical protein
MDQKGKNPGQEEEKNPVGTRNFDLLQTVQSVSGAHPASYSMDTGVLFRG